MVETAPTKKKDNTILHIVGAVILLIIIIGIYFYKQGKKTTTIAPLPTDNASTGQQSTGVGDAQLSSIATQLYNDMKGLNLFGAHDIVPFQDALSLSDTDFTKLYNIFNTKYQQEYKQTLTGWITSESAVPYSPFETVKDNMLKRLGKLNLK